MNLKFSNFSNLILFKNYYQKQDEKKFNLS